jgi:23S rRNA (cytidine1920-2'-O)/16S rRNA (cytidine1409-2'-O)-methyltransferase
MGGVVRDAAQHREVLRRLSAFATGRGLAPQGVVASPLRGPKGNREFFLHLRPGAPAMEPGALEAAIDAATAPEAAA